MIKLTVLVKRNPALSVEEFHEQWRAHGRMIAEEPVFARYIRRYEQHHRVPADYRNGDTFDGMVLQWFDSFADFLALLQTPEYSRQDAARRGPHARRAGDGDPVHRGGRGVHAVTAPARRYDARCRWRHPLLVVRRRRCTSSTTTTSGGRPARRAGAVRGLCLEGFQAGLSWITMLRKRVAFHEDFADSTRRSCRATKSGTSTAARQPRHRAAPRQDRRDHRQHVAVGDMQDAGTSLGRSCRPHAGGSARAAHVGRGSRPDRRVRRARPCPATLGMRFVGPTTVYAFMQSAGLVDDHLAGCHRAGTRAHRTPKC